MTLYRDLLAAGLQTVAIVGMSKNAGKTVALNAIVREAGVFGACLGLTSIGRDGEKRDAVHNHVKPPIFLPAGSLVATASSVLRASGLNLELLSDTACYTPLGEIYIARLLEAGNIELVGPSTVNELVSVQFQLQQAGADLVLIDGALDRKTLATPLLAEGVVLATGAVIGKDVRTVVRKTLHQVSLLHLPLPSQVQVLQIARQLIAQRKLAFVTVNGEVHELALPSSIGNEDRLREAMPPRARWLVLPGALVNRLLRYLEQSPVGIIVRDAARVFVNADRFNRYLALGGDVRVAYRANLVAITVNPTSPNNLELDPHRLCALLSQNIKNIPVHDVVTGIRYLGGELSNAAG